MSPAGRRSPHSPPGVCIGPVFALEPPLSLSNCRAIVGRAFLFGALSGRPGSGSASAQSLPWNRVSLPVKLPGNRREGFSARGSVQQARGAGSASAQSLPWNCVFLPVKLPGNRKGLFCSGLCPAGLRTIWGALYGHPFAPGLVEQLPNLRQQPLILLPGQRPAVEQPPGAALGLP